MVIRGKRCWVWQKNDEGGQLYGDGCGQTCGDHYVVQANIKLLCCIPETNIMLYNNFTLILKKI